MAAGEGGSRGGVLQLGARGGGEVSLSGEYGLIFVFCGGIYTVHRGIGKGMVARGVGVDQLVYA